MSTVHTDSSLCDAPTLDDLHGDSAVRCTGLSDVSDLEAWYAATEIPPTDEELEQLYQQEMMRRDAQAEAVKFNRMFNEAYIEVLTNMILAGIAFAPAASVA